MILNNKVYVAYTRSHRGDEFVVVNFRKIIPKIQKKALFKK